MVNTISSSPSPVDVESPLSASVVAWLADAADVVAVDASETDDDVEAEPTDVAESGAVAVA